VRSCRRFLSSRRCPTRTTRVGPRQTQGVGDLYRIYLPSKRDGMDFNLAYIPRTFTRKLKEPFETAYMRDLFKVGYDLAAKGYPWAKFPPGYAAPQGQ